MKQFVLRLVVCGVAGVLMTLLSLALPYEYCMGGTGYGLPFAVFHPGHGDSTWAIQLDPEAKTHGTELDLLYLLGNVFVWSCAVFVVSIVLRSRPKRTSGIPA